MMKTDIQSQNSRCSTCHNWNVEGLSICVNCKWIRRMHELQWRLLRHCCNAPPCWRYSLCKQKIAQNAGNLTFLVPKLFTEHAFRTVYNSHEQTCVYDVRPMQQLCTSNMAVYVEWRHMLPRVYTKTSSAVTRRSVCAARSKSVQQEKQK